MEPQMRLQTANDDRVIEITESVPVKTRISEKELIRKQEYLTTAIASFQAELDGVNAQLAMLQSEYEKAEVKR